MHSTLKAAERIENGETLKSALSSLGLFSGLLLRVLAVAEGTGHTDDMLDKAADNMEEQLNERLTRLTTVLEVGLEALGSSLELQHGRVGMVALPGLPIGNR